MTERIYYQDAYAKTFTATVISCAAKEKYWEIQLDRTAFYPEGGGQPGDAGTLGGVQVLDTRERDGQVIHLAASPLPEGSRVDGQIDWDARFSRMQHHSGEHILSGLLHRLYGVDNVGFHMGHDAVTIDLSAELSWEQLLAAEKLANQAIYDNLPVEISYPTPEALAALEYRSKKALSGQVRIVSVPGCDVCACCGTHVKRTGEIGLIKLLDCQRYKGGVRVWLLCGGRALMDYEQKNAQIKTIAASLSVKTPQAAEAVARLYAENEQQKQRLAGLQGKLFAMMAESIPEGTPTACLFEEGMDPTALRHLCLAVCKRAKIAFVFSGSQADGWKYALGSESEDVRALGKTLNQAFSGRGGGSAALVQGSLAAGKQSELLGFLPGQITPGASR